MRVLYGPRMYYSLFGARGLLLGAKTKILRKRIEVTVAVPGIAHPLFLRLRTTDVELCRQILVDGMYAYDFPRPRRVIVDAGANIGLSAIFYANRYPGARIIAIEPEPSNYAMLAKNVAAYANIIPVHAALWKDNQQVHIVDPGAGHTGFQAQNGNQGTPVRGITLGQVMTEFDIETIDLLKVDIEGSEKEVFENSSSWIDSVSAMAVEMHDWMKGGCAQAVRHAAQSFEVEFQMGEIIYFVRKRDEIIQATPATSGSARAGQDRAGGRFPLTILHSS